MKKKTLKPFLLGVLVGVVGSQVTVAMKEEEVFDKKIIIEDVKCNIEGFIEKIQEYPLVQEIEGFVKTKLNIE